MIHPDTELRFRNDEIGHAVVVTRPIPAGTIVWTLCPLDRRMTPAERAALPAPSRALLDRYAYIDAAGDFILCWDHGRYVNHACRPAMVGVGPEIEVAVRDLAPGDELTCDYGTLNLLQPLVCRCGAPDCRGEVAAEHLERIAHALDAEMARLLPLTARVAQPLAPYVRDPAQLDAWRRGTAPLPSARGYAAAPR